VNKTKIEWSDMTWNPVTGCYHGCEYCYARDIARRFGTLEKCKHDFLPESILGMRTKQYLIAELKNLIKNKPYPYDFIPTFHRYRLDEPAKIKKPQNIFVCSMADLFGEWVPDKWIDAVFEACEKAPQHRYLFLTKNSRRFRTFQNFHADNMWFGQTITGIDRELCSYTGHNIFLSIEPLLGEFTAVDMWKHFRWVIIGAETGSRKCKIIPNREWIESIVDECRRANVSVFLKNNLREIWQEPLIQEYPWKRDK